MPPDVGKILLNVSQRCFSAKLPLLLVLAGTPSIFDALEATKASFRERFLQLPIGRLEDRTAARDALAIPAERAGRPFDEDALDLLVEESHLYPYFVQALGAASWKVAMAEDHGRISRQDAALGAERSRNARKRFYARRTEEFTKRKILAEARAVSMAMRECGKNPRLPYGTLDKVLKKATSTTGNSHMEVRRNLLNLGLVWLTPDSYWEPGIPSLCDYLADFPEDGSGESESG